MFQIVLILDDLCKYRKSTQNLDTQIYVYVDIPVDALQDSLYTRRHKYCLLYTTPDFHLFLPSMSPTTVPNITPWFYNSLLLVNDSTCARDRDEARYKPCLRRGFQRQSPVPLVFLGTHADSQYNTGYYKMMNASNLNRLIHKSSYSLNP